MIPQTKRIKTGTWTPTLTTLEGKAPTMTYIIREGMYKKIDNFVYIDFAIRGKITALNGTENYGCITGLPFKAKSNRHWLRNIINIGALTKLLNKDTNAGIIVQDSTLRIQYNYGVFAATLKVTDSTNDTDYFDISGSGWYETE